MTNLFWGQALSMNVSNLMVRIAGTASSNYTYTQVNAIGSGLDKK